MSNQYGPRIVTDGLVLCLDAANNKSYPGSGTVWNDLSGNNNNGTLINGPTYSGNDKGSIVFDGTNDYAQITGSITTSSATFIVWINRNGDQDAYDGIMHSRSTNITGINFQSSNNLAYNWNDASNTWSWLSGLVIPNLRWCMCAVSVMASSAILYVYQSSGITTATNSVSHGSTVIDNINIGRDSFGGRFFRGNISSCLIYTRALSVNEIQQNYNATKGRFGL